MNPALAIFSGEIARLGQQFLNVFSLSDFSSCCDKRSLLTSTLLSLAFECDWTTWSSKSNVVLKVSLHVLLTMQGNLCLGNGIVTSNSSSSLVDDSWFCSIISSFWVWEDEDDPMTEHRKKFPMCWKMKSEQSGFKDIHKEHQHNVWNDFYLNKPLKMVQCKHCSSIMKIFMNNMKIHLETCEKIPQ